MFNTPRLFVRDWQVSDAAEFLALTNDSGFSAFLITDYRQKNLDAAERWISSQRGKYAVCSLESKELLGMGGLTPWTWEHEELVDITYRLKRSAWGKGYGWELAEGLRDYGLQVLKLPQITATITPDNIPSKRIAEKLGFKFDRHIMLKGVATDLYRFWSSDQTWSDLSS